MNSDPALSLNVYLKAGCFISWNSSLFTWRMISAYLLKNTFFNALRIWHVHILYFDCIHLDLLPNLCPFPTLFIVFVTRPILYSPVWDHSLELGWPTMSHTLKENWLSCPEKPPTVSSSSASGESSRVPLQSSWSVDETDLAQKSFLFLFILLKELYFLNQPYQHKHYIKFTVSKMPWTKAA